MLVDPEAALASCSRVSIGICLAQPLQHLLECVFLLLSLQQIRIKASKGIGALTQTDGCFFLKVKILATWRTVHLWTHKSKLFDCKEEGMQGARGSRRAPSCFRGTTSSVPLMSVDLERQQPSKFSPDIGNSLELDFFLSNQAIAVSLENSFLWGKCNVLPLQAGASTIIFWWFIKLIWL